MAKKIQASFFIYAFSSHFLKNLWQSQNFQNKDKILLRFIVDMGFSLLRNENQKTIISTQWRLCKMNHVKCRIFNFIFIFYFETKDVYSNAKKDFQFWLHGCRLCSLRIKWSWSFNFQNPSLCMLHFTILYELLCFAFIFQRWKYPVHNKSYKFRFFLLRFELKKLQPFWDRPEFQSFETPHHRRPWLSKEPTWCAFASITQLLSLLLLRRRRQSVNANHAHLKQFVSLISAA